MAKRIVTLNIGAANIELAEYAVGAQDALTLANYGVAPLPAPLDETNAEAVLTPTLQALARERGIRPGEVAVSVSAQMVFPRFAALPMAGGEEKFEQLVRYEIEQNIPLPIDEMICDRQILGDLENGDKAVMIAAAKTDQIEALSAAVSAAGFRPGVVTAAPLALTNAVRYNRPDEAEADLVLLDIGARTTSLVIVQGDRVYCRAIPVAGQTVTREISQALGCTPEEAEAYKLERGYVSFGGVNEDEDEVTDRISKVCRAVLTRLNAEISRSINFYRSQQGGGVPQKLYLTGGSALLPQADAFFADALGVEVELFNPFERLNLGARLDTTALESDAAELAASAGLALQTAGAAHFAVNLLPPSLIEEKTERARIPFLLAAGLTLVAALALLALGLRNQTATLVSRRDTIKTFSDLLGGWEKKVDRDQKQFKEVEASAATLCRLVASRATAVQRLNAVRSALVPGMWIERWEGGRVTVRYWTDRVAKSGAKTPGEAVVDKLKGRTSVVVPESIRIADMTSLGKGELAQFTVEMKYK